MNGSNVIEWEEKHCSRLRQEFLKYGGFIDWDLDVDLSCDETLLDNPSYQQFVITDMCENDWEAEYEDFLLEQALERAKERREEATEQDKAGFPSHALNGKD